MGVTHYFERPAELPRRTFSAAAEDCRTVLAALAATGVCVQREFDDPAPPALSGDVVRFNGAGEDGHETFYLPRVFDEPFPGQVPTDGRWFAFCKTARKPYDVAVCSRLVVFAHHFGNSFRVASDADEEADPAGWPAAREVCRRVLGYGAEFRVPWPGPGRSG